MREVASPPKTLKTRRKPLPNTHVTKMPQQMQDKPTLANTLKIIVLAMLADQIVRINFAQ